MGFDKIQKIILKSVNVAKFYIFLMYEKFTYFDIQKNHIRRIKFVKRKLEEAYI
jgi:hypothetical protein